MHVETWIKLDQQVKADKEAVLIYYINLKREEERRVGKLIIYLLT
jgi:hypothetical protein